MSLLSRNELLQKLLASLSESGKFAAATGREKPFLLRVAQPDGTVLALRVFIWNCTHGGANRPEDEYRIQFTGKLPEIDPSAITLLLGWHDGYGVYAAWDIDRHDGVSSSSPSAQIKEGVLQRAHSQSFATAPNQHGEITVAFRPELLEDYALSSRLLHKGGTSVPDFQLLNDVPDIDSDRISDIASIERRDVVSRIVRKFRASDFRQRVLAAYSYSCAICGTQLNLVEAAHIDPVTNPGSTDETKNGIALCKLHHAAFDQALISFDDGFRIEVSESRLVALSAAARGGGASAFKRSLRPMIALPADRRDYPDKAYIRRSRTVRRWSL